MAPTRQGRRQRRVARRRQEILAAAARVFARKGYAGATTKEIAEEADVAEGTLYNYFGGKRDILRAVAVETEAPTCRPCPRGPTGDGHVFRGRRSSATRGAASAPAIRT